MTDVDMLKGFLAGAHVDDAVFALRPDYRAMLLGRRTSQGDIRRQRQGPDNRITVIARFGEMPLANATPVKGNGAAIIGAAHRVLDQPLRDLVGQFDVFGLTGLPEPGDGLVRCR